MSYFAGPMSGVFLFLSSFSFFFFFIPFFFYFFIFFSNSEVLVEVLDLEIHKQDLKCTNGFPPLYTCTVLLRHPSLSSKQAQQKLRDISCVMN